MAVYPASPAFRHESTPTYKKGAIRTESEASYGMTRSRFTKNRAHFNLEYVITKEQFKILKDFFLSHQGEIFDFVHPDEPLKTYKVMFAMDEIQAPGISKNACKTTVQLIEV